MEPEVEAEDETERGNFEVQSEEAMKLMQMSRTDSKPMKRYLNVERVRFDASSCHRAPLEMIEFV